MPVKGQDQCKTTFGSYTEDFKSKAFIQVGYMARVVIESRA